MQPPSQLLRGHSPLRPDGTPRSSIDVRPRLPLRPTAFGPGGAHRAEAGGKVAHPAAVAAAAAAAERMTSRLHTSRRMRQPKLVKPHPQVNRQLFILRTIKICNSASLVSNWLSSFRSFRLSHLTCVLVPFH